AAMNCGVTTLRVRFSLLRIRVHSVLWKKNSLFLMAGPPIEYPNWLRVKPPFLPMAPQLFGSVSGKFGSHVPCAWAKERAEVFSYVLAANADTRLNSYAVPWNEFVPDLVATLMMPPPARPYSAVKSLVTMLNSCTESRGTFCPTEAVNRSTFSEPSSRMSVLAARWPLIETPAPRKLGSVLDTFPAVCARS